MKPIKHESTSSDALVCKKETFEGLALLTSQVGPQACKAGVCLTEDLKLCWGGGAVVHLLLFQVMLLNPL